MRWKYPPAKRCLSAISRRDFVNGVLVATSLGLGRTAFPGAMAATAGMCGDVAPRDPHMLRGGNLPGAFSVAHWMRDRRLKFSPRQAILSAGCDGRAGSFDIDEGDESFDVIILGGGLAGLSTAFFVLRHHPQTRILILDANAQAGGNAARDSAPPLPVVTSTAGAYISAPAAEAEIDLYKEVGIEWERQRVADPAFNFFFDENTPGAKPGHSGWSLDAFGKGLRALPYPSNVIADFERCRNAFVKWYNTDGAPTDPPDSSDPRYDYLSEMTFADYLTDSLRCDPLVSDFYTRYTVDALSGAAHQINAHSAISFLSGDYKGDLITFPGGTSEIARRLISWLTLADVPRRAVEIRTEAVALKVDVETGLPSASVVYFKDEAFRRARARALVIATNAQSARRLVDHLSSAERRRAWDSIKDAPAVTASVVLRSAAPLIDLGLGFDQYWWGSRYWADFIVADWITANRYKPDRSTVLTFYGGNSAPAEDLASERMKLLATPFDAYEKSLKDDLSRILARTRFDFDRDVAAISVYRWGHGMLMPTPGSIFGTTRNANGRLERAKAPRRIACWPLGPISFAGQHAEGSPCVGSAIGSGHRAAHEVLARL